VIHTLQSYDFKRREPVKLDKHKPPFVVNLLKKCLKSMKNLFEKYRKSRFGRKKNHNPINSGY